VEIKDYIALLTIDTGPLNVLSHEHTTELPQLFDSFSMNPEVRVVVLTGAGERAFTAGADIKNLPKDASSGRMRRRAPRIYHEAILDCTVPVIAAVNGYCLGHGMAMISACDIVLASTNAYFGLPEINIGAANGYRFMLEFFPRGHARWAYYSGEYIDGAEAYRVGAAYSLEQPADLMPKAMSMAKTIAGKSPRAMQLFRETSKWVDPMDTQRGYRFEGEAYQKVAADPAARAEMREAREAFIAKRSPNFV
jgi:enoyl-CoA hydratase